MESSPNPSTNSGAWASMSAGAMSSSWRTSMINCLISSSVTRTRFTFLSKNLEQVRGHPARREHVIGSAFDKRTTAISSITSK